MLKMTLKTDFKPGVNRKDDMVTADWRFLLPNLELKRVGFFGAPPLSTLRVFSRMGAAVFLIGEDLRALQQIREKSTRQGLRNVEICSVNGAFDVPIPHGSLDAGFITNAAHARKLLGKVEHFEKFCDLLSPGNAFLYLLLRSPFDNRWYRKAVARLKEAGFQPPRVYHLAPAIGYIRSAVPLDDVATDRFFISKMVYSQTRKNKALKAFSALFGSFPRAIVSRRGSVSKGHNAPDFLQTIAQKSGVDLTAFNWGLSAGGKNNSKKILYFFLDKQRVQLEIIAKMTRSPEFNYRLENEHRVLQTLAKNDIAPEGSVPKPLFFDYHCELTVLAQQAIHGRSFRSATAATDDCPYAQKAIEWITGIGEKSCHANLVTPVQVSEKLMLLYEKFVHIYDVSEVQQRLLRDSIQSMADIPAQFPLVFQHGDPGPWNMILTGSDQIAVIDWEAGESQGMPLWDLFYFIKTYSTMAARKAHGVKNSTEAFRQQFLSKTAMGKLLIKATQSYCQRINLDARWVAPLFYTCWMHRSLKEAMRLPAEQLQNGHYVNVFKLSAENRASGVLKELFDLG